MTNQHPITPPPGLVDQWYCNSACASGLTVATQAARWGADMELEACCEWLCSSSGNYYADIAVKLRDRRRPKPPSLKEQALHILDTHGDLTRAEADTIRRALETIPDEQNQRDISFGESLNK